MKLRFGLGRAVRRAGMAVVDARYLGLGLALV